MNNNKEQEMLETLRRKRAEEGGFTLIELLLVIVILGVLAAVVVLSVRGITDRGESAACGATYTATVTALEAYYAQEGEYPDDLASLVPTFLTQGNGVTIDGGQISASNWTLSYTGGGTSYTFPNSCSTTSTTSTTADPAG